MFEAPILERPPVTDFREAEKVVSVLTVEIKQCIVKKANGGDSVGDEFLDSTVFKGQNDLAADRKAGILWFDQKTQFARRLLHTLCLVAKFSVFHSVPLRNIENQPVDAIKLTDGLLWLRWRYDDLRIDLQTVAGCGDQTLQRSTSKKMWRQFSYESSKTHRIIPSYVSFRRKLNRLERQLLQVAGEIRIRFKSVLATQGWGIPGAYLRLRYHVDLPEEVINLQRDVNGDFAVWSLRLNNSNFHGMLPNAKLTLMRRHMRRTFMVGVCETPLFAVENFDGRNSLRGNRHGLLMFRPPVIDQVQQNNKTAALGHGDHAMKHNRVPCNSDRLSTVTEKQTSLGPVAAVILTQIEWRPKSGEVKNVAWPWEYETSHGIAESHSNFI